MATTIETDKYLDELRESGVTNMFGAAQYLVAEFGLGTREAKKILITWMQKPEGRRLEGPGKGTR